MLLTSSRDVVISRHQSTKVHRVEDPLRLDGLSSKFLGSCGSINDQMCHAIIVKFERSAWVELAVPRNFSAKRSEEEGKRSSRALAGNEHLATLENEMKTWRRFPSRRTLKIFFCDRWVFSCSMAFWRPSSPVAAASSSISSSLSSMALLNIRN